MNEARRFAASVLGVSVFIALLVACAIVVVGLGLRSLGPERGKGVKVLSTNPETDFANADFANINLDSGLMFKSYRKKKLHELETYRWVDRRHGIVQVPIEVAMKIYAAPLNASAKNTQSLRHKGETQ
jgi:hypothetical protein